MARGSNIAEYVAPTVKLSMSPVGTAAWETAGRRIGPQYNEAASETKAAGEAQAQGYKALMWPYDILKLYEDYAKEPSAPTRGISNRLGGGAVGTRAPGSSYSPADHQQVSRGMGALGSALSDGGYQLARGTGSGRSDPGYLASFGPHGETYVDGVPVVQDANGNPVYTVSSAAQKALQQYNQALDKYEQQYTDQAVETQKYWTRYYGGDPNQTDQSYNPTNAQEVLGNPGPPPVPDQPTSFIDKLSQLFGGSSSPDATAYNTP